MNSPRGLAQSSAFSQGTTRMRLNLGNIKKMTAPVPPLPVQKQIVNELSALLQHIDGIASQQRYAVSNCNAILRTLMEAPQ